MEWAPISESSRFAPSDCSGVSRFGKYFRAIFDRADLFAIADGLSQPDRGTVTLDNLPLTFDRSALKRWRQRVGLVFQDPEQQLVAPTVAADISYGLCNQDLSDAEVAIKVTKTLADFNLESLAMSPLQHLSLDQKKRVSFELGMPMLWQMWSQLAPKVNPQIFAPRSMIDRGFWCLSRKIYRA